MCVYNSRLHVFGFGSILHHYTQIPCRRCEMVLSTETVSPSIATQRSYPFQDKCFGDWRILEHEELSAALTFDRPGNWGGLYLERLDLVLVAAFLFQHEAEITPSEKDADLQEKTLNPCYQVFVIKDKGYLQVDIPPGANKALVKIYGNPMIELERVQKYLRHYKVRRHVLLPCVHLHMGVVDCFKKAALSYA